jgi:hypothetical protein
MRHRFESASALPFIPAVDAQTTGPALAAAGRKAIENE